MKTTLSPPKKGQETQMKETPEKQEINVYHFSHAQNFSLEGLMF